MDVTVEDASDWQTLYLSLSTHTIILEFPRAYDCGDRMNEELLSVNGLEFGVCKLRKHLI